jgi:hypothetical protein
LLQAWRHAEFDLSYSGGGFFSTDSTASNGHYHQLGLVQQFDWRRWSLAFLDQFADLPETQFGFGAGTNLSLPGVGGSLGASLPTLQGSYLPNQSIYSAIGPRYSNAFVTQIGYRISPRSSLTVAGSYGILHFTEPGNVDTNIIMRYRDTAPSESYIASARIDSLGNPRLSEITPRSLPTVVRSRGELHYSFSADLR